MKQSLAIFFVCLKLERRKNLQFIESSRRHFLISCRPWQAIDLFGRFLSLWPKVSFEFSSLYPFLKSHLVFLKKFIFFCLSR